MVFVSMTLVLWYIGFYAKIVVPSQEPCQLPDVSADLSNKVWIIYSEFSFPLKPLLTCGEHIHIRHNIRQCRRVINFRYLYPPVVTLEENKAYGSWHTWHTWHWSFLIHLLKLPKGRCQKKNVKVWSFTNSVGPPRPPPKYGLLIGNFFKVVLIN